MAAAPTIPLVGEPLALDLVNTLVHVPGQGEVDLLESKDVFREWLDHQRDRLTVWPPPGKVDRQAVRQLRHHVAHAVDRARQGQSPGSAAMQALSDAQRDAPAHRVLRWDGQVVTTTERRSGDATLDLLAQLAEVATDLLVKPAIRRVRQCEGSQCRLLFLPSHSRRQWCSPSLCGNRARVARYYERHKRP